MNTSPTPSATHKPDGGYVLVQAGQLLNAWAAHHEAIITLADLRVWLACHELVARRQGAYMRRPMADRLSELASLLGATSVSRVRSSTRRLIRAGLLHWTDAGISFPRPSLSGKALPSPKRLVPIPRPLLRHLAKGVSRGTLATTLGLLLRCVFYHRGRCTNEGTCKARWIAETFGLDERSIKRARAHLLSVRWISSCPTSQWRLNRWGGVFRVNLDWKPTPPRTPRLSPPQLRFAPRLSPPESHKHPLREYNHQKPAGRGPAGALREGVKEPCEPTLRNVERLDLLNRERTLALHQQACARGLAERSEAGRLRFVGLAMHARRCGTRNPGGLLTWLLQGRKWEFIMQIDEDQAREYLEGEGLRTRPLRPEPAPRSLAPAGSVAEGLLRRFCRTA